MADRVFDDSIAIRYMYLTNARSRVIPLLWDPVGEGRMINRSKRAKFTASASGWLHSHRDVEG